MSLIMLVLFKYDDTIMLIVIFCWTIKYLITNLLDIYIVIKIIIKIAKNECICK